MRKDLNSMSAGNTKSAPRIVVGIDGSPSSRAALRWAVRQAGLINGTVDAVMAWEIPMVAQSYGWAPVYVEETGDFEAAAKERMESVLGAELDPADSQRVSSRVINGHPAQVLLDAACDADLLVIGRRGHGSFAEALLGSVSQHCVHHAHCPVLIVRDEPARHAA
jgi:nucleotide-binding universal stress UspA family protein